MNSELRPARSGSAFALWYMVAILSLAIFVAYLDRGVIAVLVPFLKLDFSLNDIQVSLLQGIAFSFFFSLAALPLGRTVDRWNRRNLIIIGILTWSSMTLLCGLSTEFWQLFLARAGVGVGEACLLPAAYSMVANSFGNNMRGRAMSILTVATSIGGGSSTVIGGALLTLWHGADFVHLPLIGTVAPWRAVFLVAGLPGFLVAFLLLAVREPKRGPPPPPGATASDFVSYLGQHWRLLVPLYIGFSLLFFFSYATALWSPAVLVRSFGLAAGAAGMASGSVQLLSSVAGAFASGVASDAMIRRKVRNGRLQLFAIGLVPGFIGGICLGVPSANFYLVGLGLTFFASGVLTTVSYPAIYDVIPADMRGRALAAYLFLTSIFGLGGGTVAVAFITEHVFRDEQMLQYSVMVAVLGSLSLSLLLVFSSLRRYELARLALPRQVAPVDMGLGDGTAHGRTSRN